MDAVKLPEECQSLAEIRTEIDRIDRTVVHAIGQRRRYVIAAARFKKSSHEVASPERFAAMLNARRQWAEEEGLNPEMIVSLYREMVNHFIAEEAAHWHRGFAEPS